MLDLAQKIIDYKEIIEEAKKNLNREEGKIIEIKKRLKNEFDCSTVNEAEEKINLLEEKLKEKEEKLKEITTKLDNDYNWE